VPKGGVTIVAHALRGRAPGGEEDSWYRKTSMQRETDHANRGGGSLGKGPNWGESWR